MDRPAVLRSLSDAVLRGAEPPPARVLASRSWFPWLVVANTCIAAFIGQVDASIVQLALPRLESAFQAQLATVSWVAIGYVLAFAAVLPVHARLAEIYGRKLQYLLGFAGFGIASALCALAPDLTLLIVFRLVQGFFGAVLGANSIVILVAAAGPARKGRAIGFFAAAQAVGISAGPAVGGLLLAIADWRAIFWVSVPFAAAAAALGWFVIPLTPARKPSSFDVRGAVLLMPALSALLLAITEAHAWGPLSAWTLGCAAIASVLLVLFVRTEHRVRAPLLDLRLFASPAFSGGSVAVTLSYAMLYGMFFAASFALVRGYGEAPLAAGLRLALVPVALGLIAPFAGGFSERWPRAMPLLGMAVCLAAAALLRGVMTGTPQSLAPVMIALAAYGAGLGMFIAPNNNATLSAAPEESAGEAGGLLNLLRVFGTGLGVACASAVLAWRLELSTGIHQHTVGAPEPALLAAVGDVLALLGLMAVVAGAATLLRGGPRPRAVVAAGAAR
ncbi:MAG TPA: MFS transporter [Acetobacteraceae bacterium]|nr:MFS transporter [Acetobacteraceae bacterium]